MPTIVSSDIIQGPVILTHAGATFYFADAIQIVGTRNESPIATDMWGEVDGSTQDVIYTITGTPLPFNAESAAALWPFGSTVPGTYVVGAVDTPLVIQSRGGIQMTFGRAVLSQMPPINTSSTAALIGQAQWTAIRKGGVALSTANSIYATASQAFADTSFNPAQILRGPFSTSLGDLDPLRTEAGVQISFGLTLQPERTDEEGIFDWTFQGATCNASLIPAGISLAEWDALVQMQGTGVDTGTRTSAVAVALAITKAGFAFAVPKAAVMSATQRGGARVRLPGPVALKAIRGFTDGAQDALFTIGTGA